MLSSYYVMRLLETAGLPPGVINFLPGDAVSISNTILDHPELAGIHFTGSTGVFNSMWQKVGQNLGKYRGYPRLVGETGGKDFIVVHASADPQAVAVAARARRVRIPGTEVFRGEPHVCAEVALERHSRSHGRDDEGHQGRRRSRLPQLHGRGHRQESVRQDQRLHRRREEEREGDPGGGCKGDEGYFIEPTLVESPDPSYRLLCEEIFGPCCRSTRTTMQSGRKRSISSIAHHRMR
jgi:1-pyrroline-5-carboxylate dehydrogenase